MLLSKYEACCTKWELFWYVTFTDWQTKTDHRDLWGRPLQHFIIVIEWQNDNNMVYFLIQWQKDKNIVNIASANGKDPSENFSLKNLHFGSPKSEERIQWQKDKNIVKTVSANGRRSKWKDCILDLLKVRRGCDLASTGSYLLSQLAPATPGIWASNPKN